MTTTFSVRAKPSLLAKIQARAAELGFDDRSKFILWLVEQDLSRGAPKHKFSSEDLLGSVETGLKDGTNATIRRLAAQRSKRHAENR